MPRDKAVGHIGQTGCSEDNKRGDSPARKKEVDDKGDRQNPQHAQDIRHRYDFMLVTIFHVHLFLRLTNCTLYKGHKRTDILYHKVRKNKRGNDMFFCFFI